MRCQGKNVRRQAGIDSVYNSCSSARVEGKTDHISFPKQLLMELCTPELRAQEFNARLVPRDEILAAPADIRELSIVVVFWRVRVRTTNGLRRRQRTVAF